MAISQCYKIKMQEPELCKPAQFVYPNNNSDEISGFITHVEGEYAIMAMFEPVEMPTCATNIAETLSMEEVTQLLQSSLEKNPEMKLAWLAAIENSYVAIKDQND